MTRKRAPLLELLQRSGKRGQVAGAEAPRTIPEEAGRGADELPEPELKLEIMLPSVVEEPVKAAGPVSQEVLHDAVVEALKSEGEGNMAQHKAGTAEVNVSLELLTVPETTKGASAPTLENATTNGLAQTLQQEALSSLLVVTWNCSGFLKSHALIKAHYGGLGTYLHRVGAAVFCVQESKVLPCWIQNERDAAERGAVLEGYRSFWAFNELKGKQSGYNGVATWIREDVAALSGVRATQEVLGDPLDKEGRCLLVDLGGVAVLNAYAPHVDSEAAGEARQAVIAKKRRFLELLGARVRALRCAGKRVLLCGDLNLTWRPEDCSAGRRWAQVGGGGAGVAAASTKADGGWLRLGDAAKALRVSCSAPSAHMAARLALLSDQLQVTSSFTIGGKEVNAGRTLLAVNGRGVERVEHVQAALDTSPTASMDFGLREEDLAKESQSSHYVHERECVESLRSMLKPEGHLVDTFVHAHPKAADRFTCWNQHLNLRYSNGGSRLDYILCDADLLCSLVSTPTAELPGASSLYSGGTSQAARDAATSSGRWREAPRREAYGGEAGLALQQDDMRLNNSQFVQPHTGMVYTPPSYSDHVAACALFSDSTLFHGKLVVSEKETRRCTPWAAQPGLSSFFGRATKCS
mmetsp:Transcript_44745/g.127741  ORF Transcript_44745/g.127741 Transcript_44745/m.127741 type:complete len:637 (+) Transcript_44745:54-1964(+)